MRDVAERGFVVAHRLSEREPYLDEVLADPPAAVWLDEWDGPWVQAEHVGSLHAAGADTWYVSPELHRPTPPAALAQRWREVLGYGVTGICTDHPRALRELAGGFA